MIFDTPLCTWTKIIIMCCLSLSCVRVSSRKNQLQLCTARPRTQDVWTSVRDWVSSRKNGILRKKPDEARCIYIDLYSCEDEQSLCNGIYVFTKFFCTKDTIIFQHCWNTGLSLFCTVLLNMMCAEQKSRCKTSLANRLLPDSIYTRDE